MKTIFFDLETTDLNFVGQILNYAFVVVDENWNVIEQLTGKIKISRFQLPSPYAILSNRVDVLKHQQEVSEEEPYAMSRIKNWLNNIVEEEGDDIKLIGYNSMKFDVPFLRTSMIRNGINPYHWNLKYTDLLNVCQKLATANPSFRDRLGPGLSLKLQNVAQCEGVLEGQQDHESLSDVILTINLAKHLAANYGIDVRTYRQYEPEKYEDGERVVIKVSPERDEKYHREYYFNYKSRARLVALDVDKNYSLWVDIDDWRDGKRKDAVSWYAKQYSPFFIDGVDDSEEALELAESAQESLADINLSNFFPPRNCDIEQFIYMMKFDELNALYDAIWRNDLSTLKAIGGKYSSQLYLRYVANFRSLDKESVRALFKDYALYRYGGKLKTNKMDDQSEYQEGVFNPSFHITYNELSAQVDSLIKEKTGEDKKLLQSLREFYDNSDIVAVAGKELSEIERTKT